MISVIIPAYNEEKYLGACLKSILKHRTSDVCEIIVVDNASTDGTVALAKQFPEVTVLSEMRKGPNFARQTGLQVCRGDLCAFFDADTIVPPGWFQKVQREFDRHPEIVCINGEYYFFDLPRISRTCIWYTYRILAHCMHFLRGYVPNAGNFVATKKALLTIGGFNTSLAYLGDDTDIAKRLNTVGPSVFSNRFFVYASGRRFAKDGIVIAHLQYVSNYLWGSLFRKPFTNEFKDIR